MPDAQDQTFHKKMKTGVALIAAAVAKVWANPNLAIDRDALLRDPPEIKIEPLTEGLASRPGKPTTRNADLQHPEYRSAFFRDALGSESGHMSHRDFILATAWSIKNYVTAEDVKQSWAQTHLFPFAPEGYQQW